MKMCAKENLTEVRNRPSAEAPPLHPILLTNLPLRRPPIRNQPDIPVRSQCALNIAHDTKRDRDRAPGEGRRNCRKAQNCVWGKQPLMSLVETCGHALSKSGNLTAL